jgi:hypothetical protein
MDQGRRLKGLASQLLRHARGGQAPQFGIDQRKQFFGSAFFAATDGLEDLRYFSGLSHGLPSFTAAWAEIQDQSQQVMHRLKTC